MADSESHYDDVSVDDHRADEHIAKLIQAHTSAASRQNGPSKKWDPEVFVTYYIPSEMNIPHHMRQKLDLTVHPDRAPGLHYNIKALVKRRANVPDVGFDAQGWQNWYWKPTTASFLTRQQHEQYAYTARDPDELLATLALAKTKFKQLCGARPDARLRVHIHGRTVVRRLGSYVTHHATHALINANQAANHAKAVEALRTRRALRIIKNHMLANPYTPIGRRRLLAEFESMQ
jgi:hypothetical protein